MPTRYRVDPASAPGKRCRARARSLRRQLAEPERKLWWHLRHRLPVAGSHFRRQVPLGPYVVDFCCLGTHLIIEVDGEQHGFPENAAHDALRTADLERQGFRVLRFSNREVMTSIDVVLDTIHAALGTAPPTPAPPHEGEGRASVR